MTKKVFLGGTTNNSTWRKDLIPLLDSTTKVSYFNPVVEDWNEQAKLSKKKSDNDKTLFITQEILGFYAIAEVVEDSNKRPDKTIFCYLEEGFEKHQIKSLAATARLVKNNGAQVLTSLQEVADYLNSEQQFEAQVEVPVRRCPSCQIV